MNRETTGEALTVRGKSDKRNSSKPRFKSKSHSKIPVKDECSFCRQIGHWKKDCPKAKNKDKKKSSDANIASLVRLKMMMMTSSR